MMRSAPTCWREHRWRRSRHRSSSFSSGESCPSSPPSSCSAGGDVVSDDSTVDARNLLTVNESLSIPRNELDVRVSRSSGAGGQHVNKTSSRVEILWNIPGSRALTEEQRTRLREKLASRLTGDGSSSVVASDMRTRSRTRDSAEQRL